MALTTIPVELVTLDDGVTITVDDNSDTLTLTSTDADASVGPVLNLYRNSSSPADSDLVGSIKAVARNDNSQDVTTFKIANYITDVSDGTEDAASFFYLMEGGSLRERIGLSSSATVINEDGVDVDFRVEGNGQTHALFVRGSDDKVSINTDTPTAYLDVRAPTGVAGPKVAFFHSINHNLGVAIDVGSTWTNLQTNNTSYPLTINADGGRVGIGTTGPRSVLDVVGDHAAGYIITAQNDGNNINRYGIKIIAGSDDSSGTSYLLDFFDGDGTNVGSVTNAGGTVSYGAFTAHHPCVIPDEDNVIPDEDSDEDPTKPAYPYGTLLETTSLSYSKNSDDSDTERGIIYNVQKSSGAYSRKVLGAYGGSMNQGPEEETNKHQALILGDGHILCNNEKGNISVGDGICTSSTAGIGMKADKMAMIIGIAQEDVTFSGSETKLVAVQYGLQQFTPWTD